MGDSDREMVEPSNVVISSASVASSSSKKYDQALIIYQSGGIIQAPGLVRFNSNTLPRPRRLSGVKIKQPATVNHKSI